MADRTEIRFVNIDEFKGKLNLITNTLPNVIDKLLKYTAGLVLKSVRMKTPVRTGNLRRKWAIGEISSGGDNSSVEIINNAEYAQAVEYGKHSGKGGFFEGRFMLKRALDETESNIVYIVEAFMQKFIDKVVGK